MVDNGPMPQKQLPAPRRIFPLSAIVGQETLKLALLLNAVDPAIGGLLVRGEKGSGKSTAARGLAALLPDNAPFVELPVGATEDRVVGALDLQGALVDGERRLQPGLLADADGGVLYVDEVNLLPDHLVDVLLDVASSGTNRVERDGLAIEHPARFVLVGSMNPEEGELRPQLLDRFGLSVNVIAPRDPVERAEAVRRRLRFERDPESFADEYAKEEGTLAEAIVAARRLLPKVSIPDDVLRFTTSLCSELRAEGLRADLVLTRSVAALSALEGRDAATDDDVTRLAPLALAHRRRQGPFDTPGLTPDELSDATERARRGDRDTTTSGDPADHQQGEPQQGEPQQPTPSSPLTEPAAGTERVANADDRPALRIETQRASGALGRRQRGPAAGGGIVATRFPDQDASPVRDLAITATVQAAAVRRALGDSSVAVAAEDLREAVREARTANLVIFVVDASGSMGAERRMEAAKGAVLSLLLDAYQRRDRVALVTFRGDNAEVVLRPTGSIEVAKERLAELPTGGRTPLAAGISSAHNLARAALLRDESRQPILVLVTDGRATPSVASRQASGLETAITAASEVCRAGIEALVVDAEDGPTRLGLALELAEAMGARYIALDNLAAGSLTAAVNSALNR